jgi:hypothetical protein
MKQKPKRTAKPKPTRQTNPSFAELLSQDPELSAVRTEYAGKSAEERHSAAEWEYNASIANTDKHRFSKQSRFTCWMPPLLAPTPLESAFICVNLRFCFPF